MIYDYDELTFEKVQRKFLWNQSAIHRVDSRGGTEPGSARLGSAR